MKIASFFSDHKDNSYSLRKMKQENTHRKSWSSEAPLPIDNWVDVLSDISWCTCAYIYHFYKLDYRMHVILWSIPLLTVCWDVFSVAVAISTMLLTGCIVLLLWLYCTLFKQSHVDKHVSCFQYRHYKNMINMISTNILITWTIPFQVQFWKWDCWHKGHLYFLFGCIVPSLKGCNLHTLPIYFECAHFSYFLPMSAKNDLCLSDSWNFFLN